MQLTACYEVDKIPVFVKEAFICWNSRWLIVNPDSVLIKIDSVLLSDQRPRNPDDTVLSPAFVANLLKSKNTFNPDRQLMYLGLNEQYMLIAYIGDNICWQYCPVMLFRFENKKIKSVMYWRSTSEKVKTKEDVLKSLRCLGPELITPAI